MAVLVTQKHPGHNDKRNACYEDRRLDIDDGEDEREHSGEEKLKRIARDGDFGSQRSKCLHEEAILYVIPILDLNVPSRHPERSRRGALAWFDSAHHDNYGAFELRIGIILWLLSSR